MQSSDGLNSIPFWPKLFCPLCKKSIQIDITKLSAHVPDMAQPCYFRILHLNFATGTVSEVWYHSPTHTLFKFLRKICLSKWASLVAQMVWLKCLYKLCLKTREVQSLHCRVKWSTRTSGWGPNWGGALGERVKDCAYIHHFSPIYYLLEVFSVTTVKNLGLFDWC